MSLQTLQTLPTVLVVDSGVGGLSIYQQLWQRLPELHYLYAFDNAGFPYGDLAADAVTQRLIALIQAIQRQQAFHLVVIACNTASTTALPGLRKYLSVPVIGVVPAIKPAVAMTRNGVIGLLATPATIQRPYIDALIQQFAAHCQVKRLGSTELVRLAEAKARGVRIPTKILETILAPWLQQPELPDTVVLGCTHFAWLKEELLSVLPPETQLLDSTVAITRQAERILLSRLGYSADRESQRVPTLLRGSNQAYCTRWDRETEVLQPTLHSYQLPSLQLIG